MSDSNLSGLTAEAISQYIVDAFPGVDVFTAGGTTFFSFDPVSHWPAFATLMTTDEVAEDVSNLSRPGVFRLNIGVSGATFDRLVGDVHDPDYAVGDRLLPHPDYARQHWLAILNPSAQTFEEVIWPLLVEAHDRLAAVRARHAP
jgi:hypothetical protein